MSHSLQIGQPFPAFALPAIVSQVGEFKESTIDNATMSAQPFVLFVYPRDNTEGCTLEACNFSALYPDFQKLGVGVLGLSRDTVRSHKNFINKQGLAYPLLADLDGVWLREHGFIYDGQMYGKPVTRVRRTTVYVDGDGVIGKIWDDVSPPGHAAQVLEWVQGKGG